MRLGNSEVALIACGALSVHAGEAVERYGWPIDIHPVNPLVHAQPRRIVPEVQRLYDDLAGRYRSVVIGFADCGTRGALQQWSAEHGVPMMAGLHCYDMYAGQGAADRMFTDEPGTFLLTDFMVRAFDKIVVHSLGLDRYPELHADYFQHFTRVVWLAQEPTPALEAAAAEQAAYIGGRLEIVPTPLTTFERELEALLQAVV